MNPDKINPDNLFRNLSKSNKIAVWGWWQGRNLGDLWILETIKKKFPGIIPITTEEEDFSKYDFIIIGGGGLLNGPYLRKPFDSTIPTKYGAFGLGGEFEITDKEKLQKFINTSVFFGVRDKRNLETYKIPDNKKLEMSGDCTFMYQLKRVIPNKIIKNIKLIWRDPFGLLKWDTSKHHAKDGHILNKLFGDHLGPVPHNDNAKCLELYQSILKKYGIVGFDNYNVPKFAINDLYERFKNIDLVVTMRYHGVIAAIQLGIPCIAIDIYPKVRTLMKDAGLERFCIKITEYNKIHNIINDIKTNWDIIRKNMENFTNEQFIIANSFANKIKNKIIYLMNEKQKKLNKQNITNIENNT